MSSVNIKNGWLIWLLDVLFVPFLYFLEWGKKYTSYSPREGIHFKLRVNTWDKFSVLETWKFNVYGQVELGKNDTILDIGAHIGSFAIYAATKVPKGRVLAFEPNPENFALLQDNKQMNHQDNLAIFNKAVTKETGSMDFFMNRNEVLSSVFNTVGQKVRVSTITLADILSENLLDKVDLLKMDVEGAEYQVILNSSRETLQKIKRIEMEFHEFAETKENASVLVDFLTRNGFHATISGPRFLRLLFGIGYISAFRE